MVASLPKEWFQRFSSLQAEVGLSFLKEVDQGNQTRLGHVQEIKRRVANTSFPTGVDRGRNIYWQFMAFFDDPYRAQAHLKKHGIDTSITSLELISDLSDYPYQGDTPVAQRVCNNGLFIPSYPGLGAKDIERICHALSSYG